jgi:predicted Zn-dependent protease
MTPTGRSTTTAQRVAELLRPPTTGSWEVFGEHLTHHELHFTGHQVEMRRGPVELEGFSLRVFARREKVLGVGVTASNDLTPTGVARALDVALRTAPVATFPASTLRLPDGSISGGAPKVVDARIRDDPVGAIEQFGSELLAQFPEGRSVRPSFGSIRVTYGESSVVNSAGADRRESATFAEFEWAIRSEGGAEGRAPGEYWVNNVSRRLDPRALGVDVPRWCTLAEDARRAQAPPAGDLDVIFPARVLLDIVPPVLGFRFSGAAQLRKMAPALGEQVASPQVSVSDDPHLEWGPGSCAFDDEGEATRRRPLIGQGRVEGLIYDALHASSLGVSQMGGAHRGSSLGSTWFRFTHGVGPSASNLSIAPGDGGSDAELIESVQDGLWLDQLGYAFPDPFSGAYGGEIRIGYRIRHGKLAEPVRGGTVGGVVFGPAGTPSLLGGVTRVGTAAQQVGNLLSPALLTTKISVGGA